jgi:hypothetical protein
MGAGGHSGLYISSDMTYGSSNVSETFGNTVLSGSPFFKIKSIEVWALVD